MFKRPTNIYEVVYPFYILLKIFGLIPFSFVGPVKDGNIRVTWMDLVYYALCLFAHFVVLLDRFIKNLSIFEESVLYNRGVQTQMVALVLVIIVCGCVQAHIQVGIRNFLKILQEFDEEVRFITKMRTLTGL